MTLVGPTSNLPGYRRRSGRAGTVYRDARHLGEVISVDWNVTVEQIPVVIAGSWRTEMKPGGEERAGTFRVQDVHDAWALQVWKFIRARRDGDRSAAAFPTFSIITKLDDIGAFDYSKWQLDDCQLFEFSGGHNQEDSLLIREIPFSFRDERPLHAFVIGDSGLEITEA